MKLKHAAVGLTAGLFSLMAAHAQPLNTGDELLISLPNRAGEYISTYEFRGKYVLVDFWATWCLPCRMETPYLYKLARRHPQLVVYRVSIDNSRTKWLAMLRKWQSRGPVVNVRDPQGGYSSWLGKIGFNAIPYPVLLDKEGKILRKGDFTPHELNHFLRKGEWP